MNCLPERNYGRLKRRKMRKKWCSASSRQYWIMNRWKSQAETSKTHSWNNNFFSIFSTARYENPAKNLICFSIFETVKSKWAQRGRKKSSQAPFYAADRQSLGVDSPPLALSHAVNANVTRKNKNVFFHVAAMPWQMCVKYHRYEKSYKFHVPDPIRLMQLSIIYVALQPEFLASARPHNIFSSMRPPCVDVYTRKM